jgi:transmembrane sensor
MNDELLVSYLLNEGDEGSRQFVEHWIIENPENARYFENFKTIWDASKNLDVSTQIDENEMWARFLERASRNPVRLVVIRKFSRTLQVAATVLITITLAALGYIIYDYTDRSPVIVATHTAAQTKSLPDGSEITLNRNSTIQYTRKLRGKTRAVQLKGEAFFKVAANKEKPFVISVNDVTVTVLGTSFNVKGYEGQTEVVVETGTVMVESNGRSVTLQPGERVITSNADSSIVEQKTADKLYSYYVTKEFVCDNTPLWKLVEVLNEAYDVRIEIRNPDLRELPLTTTFHKDSLDNILNVISETFNINITRDGDRILMN